MEHAQPLPSPCPCGKSGAPAAVHRPAPHWLRSLAALPAALLSLLPSFTCPACIAAYAGLLSALGLGFVLREEFLAPAIVVFLAVGVLSVGTSARTHGRPGPLVLTIVGAVLVVSGRLVWSVPSLVYGGAALLLAASAWNLWLKRPLRSAADAAAVEAA